MTRGGLVQVLFVVFWCSFVAAEAWGKEMMAVLEVSGDQSAKERSLVTDEVRRHVKDAVGESLTLMTRENMEVMLQDMGVDPSCVAEGACEVETARNLNVDYVISGQITTLESTLILSLKLYETAGGGLLKAGRAQSDSTIGLLDALGDAARELVVPLTGKVAPVAAPSPVPAPVPVGGTPSAEELAMLARAFEAATTGQKMPGMIPPAPTPVATPEPTVATIASMLTGDEPTAVRDFYTKHRGPVTYRGGVLFDANNTYMTPKLTLALAKLDPEASKHVDRYKRTNGTVALGATVGILSAIPLSLGLINGLENDFPSSAVNTLLVGGGMFTGGIAGIIRGGTKGKKEIKAMAPAVNKVIEEYNPVAATP